MYLIRKYINDDFETGIHDNWIYGLFEERDKAVEAIRKEHEDDIARATSLGLPYGGFSVDYGPETTVTIKSYSYEREYEEYVCWEYDELYYVIKEVELNKLKNLDES